MAARLNSEPSTKKDISSVVVNGREQSLSWRPLMLRPVGIAFLLTCLAATVALLEIAARKLPHKSDSTFSYFYNETNIHVNRRSLEKRQKASAKSSTFSNFPYTQTSTVPSKSSPVIEHLTDTTSYGPGLQPVFIACGSESILVTPSTFLLSDGATFTDTPGCGSASPSEYVAQDHTITQTPPAPTPTGPPESYITIILLPTQVAIQPTISPSSTSSVASKLSNTRVLTPLTMTSSSLWASTNSHKTIGQSLSVPGLSLATQYSIDGSVSSVNQLVPAPLPTHASTMSIETSLFIAPSPSRSFGKQGGNHSMPEGSTSRETSTEYLTFTAIENFQNPWFNPSLLPPEKSTGPYLVYVCRTIWPTWGAFLGSGAFAVLIMAVLGSLWSTFYSGITLIEPFTNMAEPNGASAVDVLFTKYGGRKLLIPSWHSLRARQRCSLLACATALIFAVISPLASEILLVDTKGCNSSPPTYDSRGPNPCPPQLVVDIQALRALQCVLVLASLLIVTIVVTLRNRNASGVSDDPSSLALIASLLNHPGMVAILHSIPHEASRSETEKVFSYYRLKLSTYESPHGTLKYGIIPIRQSAPAYASKSLVSTKWTGMNWRVWLQTTTVAVFLFGLLGIVIADLKISNPRNRFNSFLNSQSFGARFIVTGAGTIISIVWQSIFTEVNSKSIFTQLAQGQAKAEDTVMTTSQPSFVGSCLQSLRRRQYLAAIVAAANIFIFVLVMALPGIPFRSGTMYLQYVICSYISMTIISVLLITLFLIALWRRRLPKWPQDPDCLAMVMNYLVDSELVSYFDKASESGESKDVTLTKVREKRWAFDKRVSADGSRRWTIVEEEGIN